MDAQSVIAVDTAVLPWEERFSEKLGRALYRKNLITDPDTGMEVRLVRYPADWPVADLFAVDDYGASGLAPRMSRKVPIRPSFHTATTRTPANSRHAAV